MSANQRPEHEQIPAPTVPAKAVPLAATLESALADAEAISINDKERKRFRVVVLYDWYLRELNMLRGERGKKSKLLSERKTLKQRLPWLDVWNAMNPEEMDEIEKMPKKQFVPNRWAIIFMCRHENRSHLDRRSVVNYRKALNERRSAR